MHGDANPNPSPSPNPNPEPEPEQVGIVHGDVDSLAGWALGVELLEPLDRKLRAELGCGPEHITPRALLLGWQVRVKG